MTCFSSIPGFARPSGWRVLRAICTFHHSVVSLFANMPCPQCKWYMPLARQLRETLWLSLLPFGNGRDFRGLGQMGQQSWRNCLNYVNVIYTQGRKRTLEGFACFNKLLRIGYFFEHRYCCYSAVLFCLRRTQFYSPCGTDMWSSFLLTRPQVTHKNACHLVEAE